MLAVNNGGQDIKSLVKAIGSVHKANLKSEESCNENELKKMVGCLKEELLF
jgi:hypothetical protein